MVMLFEHLVADQNFGDALNKKLMPRLIGDFLDGNEDIICFAIGSLINDFIEQRSVNAKRIVVLGAGVGHGTLSLGNLPNIDSRWRLYALRGPLSAAALGVSADLGMVDPGVLLITLPEVSALLEKRQPAGYRPALIPHFRSAQRADGFLREACAAAGCDYIEPNADVDGVLANIAGASRILAESMHGAIAADALRIPWCPVILGDKFEPFKWLDFCRSLDVPFRPFRNLLPPKSLGVRSLLRFSARKRQFIENMRFIAFNPEKFSLSDAALLEQQSQRLLAAIDIFRRDIASGKLS